MLVGELRRHGYLVTRRGVAAPAEGVRRRILYEVHWRGRPKQPGPDEWLDRLAAGPGVVELAWQLGPLPDRDTARPPIP